MSIRKYQGSLAAAAAIALMVSGCASFSGPEEDAEESEETESVEEAEDDDDSDEAEVEEAAAAEEDEDESDAPAPSGDYVDDLYSDSLHDGITPAEPGTAYLEIANERFEWSDIQCTLRDEPGDQLLSLSENSGDAWLTFERAVGDNRWNWEDEYVQLSVPMELEDTDLDAWSNSMIQHERAQGGTPEWDHGSGESPVIRVVDNQVTATGEMADFNPLAEALSGEFIMAATCP